MLWPTLAWTTGMAGGIGSAFAVQNSSWRYAPSLAVWTLGLWLNNTSTGDYRLFGQGAIWGSTGSLTGLFAYNLSQAYQEWFQTEIKQGMIPTQPTVEPSSSQPNPPAQSTEPNEAKKSDASGPHFLIPPRVSQGTYNSKDHWWNNKHD